MSDKIVRTRNYATVIYEDSAPKNWLQILQDLHVPCFISPLHDQDLRPDGTPKKPHRHIQLCFDSVKTPEQAQEVFDKINGVGCEVIKSFRAYARYLCHLDEHDKHLYNTSEVMALGGLNYNDSIGSASDKVQCIREMKKYVKDNKIFFFCDLFDYAEENNSMWFDALINSCSYITHKNKTKIYFKHPHL